MSHENFTFDKCPRCGGPVTEQITAKSTRILKCRKKIDGGCGLFTNCGPVPRKKIEEQRPVENSVGDGATNSGARELERVNAEPVVEREPVSPVVRREPVRVERKHVERKPVARKPVERKPVKPDERKPVEPGKRRGGFLGALERF